MTSPAASADAGLSPAAAKPGRSGDARSWPLLILAVPAAVAVWSGWVGIGQMTGFGQVHPLPGIWNSLHINTAVTLPIGVEAYATYALRAWLSTSTAVSQRTRRFAHRSVIASLLLGMAGQVAYHLLAEAGEHHAPWEITTAVSCLPVLVLGMGGALAHMLRADTRHLGLEAPAGQPARSGGPDPVDAAAFDGVRADRIALAHAAAAQLHAEGHRISRRTLRASGIRGSNRELSRLAEILNPSRLPYHEAASRQRTSPPPDTLAQLPHANQAQEGHRQ